MADITVTYGRLNHWSVYTVVTQQYVYYTDGVTIWRKGVRDGLYIRDKELNIIGFNGQESIDGGISGDWLNVWSIS